MSPETRTRPRRPLRRLLWTGLCLGLLGASPAAGAAQEEAVVRVVDVGNALCTVTRVPPGRYLVYDAGHYDGGTRCTDAVAEAVDGTEIDLLVVSHADADHLGEAEHLLHRFEVGTILRTGWERWDTSNWRAFTEAAADETLEGATVLNLRTRRPAPGREFSLGEATLTFVYGGRESCESGLEESEKRNAVSIVLRLDYEGRSVLFPGDVVGGTPAGSRARCSERVMVDRHEAGSVSVDADVLLAPHHGADDASSTEFIEAVDPSWVVVSAGRRHHHPRASAVRRYVEGAGIDPDSLFRTDRGDDEGGGEWEGVVPSCGDERGDDGVRIRLSEEGVEVGYREPVDPCEEEEE